MDTDKTGSAELQSPTLFFTPDTCSLASLIVCYEVGLEPKVEAISFQRQEQLSAAFLEINPKAKVPALLIDGVTVSETPAILTLIAELSTRPPLLPRNPLERAQVHAFNAYLCSTLHVAHAHRMRGYRWVDGEAHEEAMRRKVPEAVGSCYEYIERHVITEPYVFGENYTIADPYLFTIAQWMEADGVSPERFPKVKSHRETMRSRPAVVRALELEADLMSADT